MIGTIGFLFWSAVVLTPVLIAVSVAAHWLRRDRFSRLLRVAVAVGFLVGGLIGWTLVPAAWTASFWTTIDAAGGTRGGATRIDQVTRLSPRRALPGNSSSVRPCASTISSFRSPNKCRLRW